MHLAVVAVVATCRRPFKGQMTLDLKSKTETPLFLIWAILKSCSIKESFDFDNENGPDLLALERTFRPLRCLTEAKAEGRTSGDLCILQPKSQRPTELDAIKGFSASEILEGFGGDEFVQFHCHRCAANVYSVEQMDSVESCEFKGVAGCYGYLQSEYDENRLFSRWQARIDYQLYKVWERENLEAHGTLSILQRERLEKLLLDKNGGFVNSDAHSLYLALKACEETGDRLQIHVVPQSLIVDRNWIVPQHCSNCYLTLEKWKGSCPRCRSTAAPVSMRKRLLRGDRPYWPLVRFLGKVGTEQLANKYFVSETESESL